MALIRRIAIPYAQFPYFYLAQWDPNTDTFTLLASFNLNATGHCSSILPGEEYIAVGQQLWGVKLLRMLYWNGVVLAEVANFNPGGLGFVWECVSDPAGRDISCSFNEGAFRIVRWNGVNFAQVAIQALNGLSHAQDWNPDGTYLAVTCWSAALDLRYLIIYSWDGAALAEICNIQAAVTPPQEQPAGVSWSPDGNYIAIAKRLAPQVEVYRWTGSSLVLTGSANVAGNATDCDWDLNSEYLIVAHMNSPYTSMFKKDPDTGAISLVDTYVQDGSTHSCCFSPEGDVVATGPQSALLLPNPNCFNILSWDRATENLTLEMEEGLIDNIARGVRFLRSIAPAPPPPPPPPPPPNPPGRENPVDAIGKVKKARLPLLSPGRGLSRVRLLKPSIRVLLDPEIGG